MEGHRHFRWRGSAYDSEIWTDINQVANQFNRQNAVGNAYLRATDPVAGGFLKASCRR